MKNNFSLKFKIFDIFVLTFVIVAIVASIITTNVVFARSLNSESVVQIYYQNELIVDKQYKLSEIDDEINVVLSKSQYDRIKKDGIF